MKPLPSTSTNAKYVPGRSIAEISEQYNIPADAIIKLGSNENPLGPAPAAVRAIIEHANEVSIYPATSRQMRSSNSDRTKTRSDPRLPRSEP
jgi:histidinol-phosphate/aromatic aminotransferase/cobyric acid decarboxylase-like protein